MLYLYLAAYVAVYCYLPTAIAWVLGKLGLLD